MAQRSKAAILSWLVEQGCMIDEIDPKERLMLELLLDIRENTAP